MKKIKEVTLFERRDEQGVSWDKIRIEEDGRLFFDSYDVGQMPQEFWGHEDYEYDTYVEADWKDSVLLLLLKERFKTNAEFRAWADKKKLSYTASSWS